MKKEYICYAFEKSCKGKVDNDLYNKANFNLFFLLNEQNITIDNVRVREFTKAYYEIYYKIQHKLERMEKNYNNIDFSQLNFFQKRWCKKELERVRATYYNIGKFNSIFYNVFGISLVKVIDDIDREAKTENKQNI